MSSNAISRVLLASAKGSKEKESLDQALGSGEDTVDELCRTVLERLILRRFNGRRDGVKLDGASVLLQLARLDSAPGQKADLSLMAKLCCQYAACLHLARGKWPIGHEEVGSILPLLSKAMFSAGPISESVDTAKDNDNMNLGICSDDDSIWKEMIAVIAGCAACSLFSTYEQGLDQKNAPLRHGHKPHDASNLQLAGCVALHSLASSVYISGIDTVETRLVFVSSGGLELLLLMSQGYFPRACSPTTSPSEGGKELENHVGLGERQAGYDVLKYSCCNLLRFVPMGDFLRLQTIRRRTSTPGASAHCYALVTMRRAGSEAFRAVENALCNQMKTCSPNSACEAKCRRTKGGRSNSHKWKMEDLSQRLDLVRERASRVTPSLESRSRLCDYSKDEYKMTRKLLKGVKIEGIMNCLVKDIDFNSLDECDFVGKLISRGLRDGDDSEIEIPCADKSSTLESELQRRNRLIQEAAQKKAAREELDQIRHKQEMKRRLMRQKDEQSKRALARGEKMEHEKKWNRWVLGRKSQLVKSDMQSKLQEDKDLKRRERIFQKNMLSKQMAQAESAKEQIKQDAFKARQSKLEKEKQLHWMVAEEMEAMKHEDDRARERIAKEKDRRKREARIEKEDADRREEKLVLFWRERDLIAGRIHSGEWAKKEGVAFFRDEKETSETQSISDKLE